MKVTVAYMSRLFTNGKFKFACVTVVLFSLCAMSEDVQTALADEDKVYGELFKFDAKTPPLFLVHGDRDYYSPMASVRIYEELHKRKIPAQLFVYANASHGLGDAVNVRGWQRRIVDWIESVGF